MNMNLEITKDNGDKMELNQTDLELEYEEFEYDEDYEYYDVDDGYSQ